MKLSNKQQLVNFILAETKKIVEASPGPVAPDPGAIKHVVVVSEKLLSAINSFLENAPDELKSSMSHLEDCKKTLENALSAPSSYVARPKQEPRKVSFKAVKD